MLKDIRGEYIPAFSLLFFTLAIFVVAYKKCDRNQKLPRYHTECRDGTGVRVFEALTFDRPTFNYGVMRVGNISVTYPCMIEVLPER